MKRHDPLCPVMADERCHSVGGTSTHHDRGRAGDCRCGVRCQCSNGGTGLIARVRAEYDTPLPKVEPIQYAAIRGKALSAPRSTIEALIAQTEADAEKMDRMGNHWQATIGRLRVQGMTEALEIVKIEFDRMHDGQ